MRAREFLRENLEFGKRGEYEVGREQLWSNREKGEELHQSSNLEVKG